MIFNEYFDYDENEKAIWVKRFNANVFFQSSHVWCTYFAYLEVEDNNLPYPSPWRKSLNASASFPGCSSRTSPQSLI